MHLTWTLWEHQIVSKKQEVRFLKSKEGKCAVVSKALLKQHAMNFTSVVLPIEQLTFNSPTKFSKAVSTGGLESITCKTS